MPRRPYRARFPILIAPVVQAPSGEIAPVLLDNFAGSGALTSHTPDIYPAGSSWNITNGAFGNLSGGYLPYDTGVNGRAVIDCGLADFELRWRSKHYSAAEGAYAGGIALRSNAAANDFYGVGTLYESGLQYIYWQLPSIKVHTDQANANKYQLPLVNNTYYTWKIIIQGAFARLFDESGVLILASQAAEKLTNTYVGPSVQFYYGSWDFIEVKPVTQTFITFSVSGDSISDSSDDWPGQLSCHHNNGYCLLYNNAVAGSTVEYQMASHVTKCITDNADFTIVALGTNDSNSVHDTYETQLNRLYSNIHKPIYAMGVLPKSPEGSRADRNSEIVAAVSDAQAAGTNVTYWNTDGWIDPATDTSDGLHPTAAGHIKIMNEVLSRI
jgi:hypothetical protein